MNYTDCYYYKRRRDSVGKCELLETYCQVELEQGNFCPEYQDVYTEQMLNYVDSIIDAKEVITP